MSRFPDLVLDDRWVLSHRSGKSRVDPQKVYASLVEAEPDASGQLVDVATLFLTNRECPFHCVMCDLWKNTTDEKTASGVIPFQIRNALMTLPPARHIKLYNSGNFFDAKAIPTQDYEAIAALLEPFDNVIVECHPKLIGDRTLQFCEMLEGELEVAIGLETAHPEVLRKLNKQMDLDDFARAVKFLSQHGIRSRAFILLRPPFLTEEEGIFWAKRSIDFAFSVGIGCCVIIPTRAGNGAMDWLRREGYFDPPSLSALEEVMTYGLGLEAGRVLADLWDLNLIAAGETCFEARHSRLRDMNLRQQILPEINCPDQA